jgi:hypothetical protein
MKCRIEVQRLQYAIVEIESSGEETGDEIEKKAIESVTDWNTQGNPYIEFYEELPSL